MSEPVTSPSAPLHRADSFFGLHFDLHPQPSDKALGADTSETNIRQLLERVQPDYVQYDCKGHTGLAGYPTALGNAAEGIANDALAVWRKVTREKGVALFIHYSGVYDATALKQHPDWARIDAAGNRDPNNTSTFGPYVDELLIPQLVEACTKYDLDGVWVDGDCWSAQLDFSPAALAAWKEQTGREKAPGGADDRDWLEWKMFQRRQFERYLNHWAAGLRNARPDIDIASNWAYSTMFPFPPSVSVDFLSGDYPALDSADRARVEARYLATAGKPWDLMAWGFNGPNANLKPALQLMQEAAVVLMQGGGFQVYYQPTRRGWVAPSIIEIAGPVADFCRARKEFSFKSRSIPQVALLFPSETYWRQCDGVSISPHFLQPLEGALHALLELHYSVDVLPEFQLEPKLADYPLVVIPEAVTLPESFQRAATEYVRNGGSLLLIGEYSVRPFESMLGVEFNGEPKDTAAICESSGGLSVVAGRWQDVQIAGASRVASWYPTRDTRSSEKVAATVVGYGKGRIGAIYGPAGTANFRSHHPALRSLYGDLAAQLFPDPAVRLDGPPTVDLAWRRTEDGRLALHLLNLTNAQRGDRFTAVDFIPTVGPLSAQVRVPDKPRSVRWLPHDAPVQWNWKDGVVTAQIPALGIHGALVIELPDSN